MLSELVAAFCVMAVCVVIHITGMIALFQWLLGRRDKLKERPSSLRLSFILIMVFGVITSIHLLETAIWAVFYQVRGLFQDFETAFYFSLTSYSTVGFGDVVLPQTWRLFGGMEAIAGILLCGLSTAFIFVIVNAMLQFRKEKHAKRRKSKVKKSGDGKKLAEFKKAEDIKDITEKSFGGPNLLE